MIPISVAHSWFGGKLGSQTKAVVWRVPKPGSQNDVAAQRLLQMLLGSCWISWIQATCFGQHQALLAKWKCYQAWKWETIDSPSSPISPFFSLWAVNTPRCLAVVTSDHTILHGTSVSTHMTELCVHDLYILDMFSGIWISMKVVVMSPSSEPTWSSPSAKDKASLGKSVDTVDTLEAQNDNTGPVVQVA